MKMLLESLVLSHLSYCVTVWGPSLANTLSQRLQRMQNHAVQPCCGLRKYNHVTEFYHRLRWLPLPCFILFKSLCLITTSTINLDVFYLILQFALVEVLHIVPGHLHILLTFYVSFEAYSTFFFRDKTIIHYHHQ